MINVMGIRLNLIKEIGEISEKRVNTIKNLVGDLLPQEITIPVGHIFTNPKTKVHLLLASGQITVGQDGPEISPDFTVLRKFAQVVFDAFLLEDKANVVLNYTGLLNVENAMIRSLNIVSGVNEAITNNKINGINGIGLRFFYNEEGFTGDLKIEPYVQDVNQFFVELEVSSQIGENILGIEDIFLAAEKFFNKFTNELASFALGLTSKL